MALLFKEPVGLIGECVIFYDFVKSNLCYTLCVGRGEWGVGSGEERHSRREVGEQRCCLEYDMKLSPPLQLQV